MAFNGRLAFAVLGKNNNLFLFSLLLGASVKSSAGQGSQLRGTAATTPTTSSSTEAPRHSESAWAEAAEGKFFGVAPWDVNFGLSQATLQQLYGPVAMQRAQNWVQQKKVLWCGDAESPDAELLGQLPFPAPSTAATYWPGACPGNARAQALFDKGLAFRMLFNDNEAACAFKGAEREAPDCSMAALAQAYSLGPNVNYAELASAETYKLILDALKRAKDILENPKRSQQSEYAPAFYGALLKFYCVEGDGALEKMEALEDAAAYQTYMSQMTTCTHNWAVAISTIASNYPGDPNLQAIAAGALMQDPAWKWWYNESVTTGALANVSAAGGYANSKGAAITLASGKIQPAAALANAAIENALNTAPDHLGALHFAIHNLEQGPAPRWAEAVADRLLKFSSKQGHAIHMQTHIATRIGNYNDSFVTNLIAIQADAEWNLARAGGGIMSLLYKYVPHNTAFAAEAAQHMGNWRNMAAAIQSLNDCAGFGLVAYPGMSSLGGFLARQMLQPLRFGKYEELKLSLGEGGDGPVQGMHEDAKVSIYLPGGQHYTLDSSHGSSAALRNSLSDVRLFVLAIASARTGDAAQAEQRLLHLLASPAMNADCSGVQGFGFLGTIQRAKALADCRYQLFVRDGDLTLSSSSASASGTLTINNGDNGKAIFLLLAAAELARAQKLTDGTEHALLKQAFEYQKTMQYDEPAPFFYPVGETLAGYLLRNDSDNSSQRDLEEAEAVLRTVLFQWPRSALSSIALHSVLERKGQKAAAAYALADATRYNDTELSLEWL